MRALFHWRLAFRQIAIFPFALLTAGCASPTLDRSSALRDYQNARPCCVSLSAAKVSSLPSSSKISFQVDASDQAFGFGGDGLSFFKLFALPEGPSRYTCKVESYSSGDGRALNVFFPKVAILDESFSAIRETSDSDFRGAPPTGSKMGGVGVDVKIAPKDNARYLLIHTTKSYVENGRDVQLPAKGPSLGVGAVPYIAATIMNDNGLIHFLGAPISLPGNMEVGCFVE